jgi:hypothetical protein
VRSYPGGEYHVGVYSNVMLTVYTVIINNYDTLRPVCYADDVDWICFCNKQVKGRKPWRTVIVEAEPPFNRASRERKILSHLHVPHPSLYIDGHYEVIGDVKEFCGRLDEYAADIYQPAHYRRLAEEAKACIRLGKCSEKEIDAQMDRYRKMGLNNARIAQGGIIFRPRITEKLRRMELIWWEEIMSHTHRDQVSQPFALQESEAVCYYIPETVVSKYFRLHKHG